MLMSFFFFSLLHRNLVSLCSAQFHWKLTLGKNLTASHYFEEANVENESRRR